MVLLLSLSGCSYDDGPARSENSGRVIYKGPKGGCYYINSNGNKVYVKC